LEKGNKLLDYFQFEKAISLFIRSFDANNNPFAGLGIGKAQLDRGDFEEAEKSFLQNSFLFRDNLESILFSSLVLLNKGDIDTSIKTFEYILALVPREDLYLSLLRTFIEYAISFRMESLESFILSISKTEFLKVHPGYFFIDVGTVFTDWGCFDEGIKFYKKSLNYEDEPWIKAQALSNIGSNYANQDEHGEAIKYYKMALILEPKYSECWNNLSSSYAYLLNFNEAIDAIDKAIKYAKPHKEVFYKGQKEWYIHHLNLSFNINFLPTEKMKKFLRTGDNLIFTKDNVIKKIDYSPAISAYGKFLECFLDHYITNDLRNMIDAKYPRFSKRIDNKYLWGCDDYKGVGKVFLKWYKYGENITIGSWIVYLENLDKPTKNPILITINKFIEQHLKTNEIQSLLDICKFVVDPRNEASHDGEFIRSEALKFREDIVPKFNELITLFYKKVY